jgi:glucokinase
MTSGNDRGNAAVNRAAPWPRPVSRDAGHDLVLAADAGAALDAVVRDHGRSSVDDVVRATGLTSERTEIVLQGLYHRGLLRPEDDGVVLLPRPSGSVLAVDVGGTKVRAALADLHGTVHEEIVAATSQTDLPHQIAELLDQLRQRVGSSLAPVRAAGIGIPASYSQASDTAWNAGNLLQLTRIRPAEAFRRVLDMPVTIAQDVRLAAVAERWRGAGRACDDFVVLCLGTGVSLGIIVRGQVYEGQGSAGELCYLPLGNDPFAAEHRLRGPYEDAVSGPALARRYAEATGAADVSARDARVVLDAAAAGEHVAVGVMEREAMLLSLGITSVCAVLDPGLVVLGGGLGSSDALREPVERDVQRLMPRPPKIRTSPLGHRGPLLGAVTAALVAVPDEAATSRPEVRPSPVTYQ